MAAPTNVDQFLDLVRKSGVTDEKRLEAYLLKMRSRLPSDMDKAAGVLIDVGLLTHFQAENLLAGKWRHFSIGKYKILERLGSGGMGQVFLCEHKLMRRRVAVKVLPTARAKDSSALERFYREARAVAALDHPNIVHAYDIDQDEDLHFLVMEYVDGSNLQELIKKAGPLHVLRACHYVRQAALALQHAHEAGLVHRDIKPGNIIVDRNGVVKILDMGLARFFHDEEDVLTKKYEDGTLGTADYLSPEQALDSHAADIRADIYSLGATFYFLLTGRPPFESANVTQKLMMHQFRNPKPIQEYRTDVPAGVLAVLHKMMAKEPSQRYVIPAEVAEALDAFTQIAIAPPPTSEMPALSAAATGVFPGMDSADTASSSANQRDTPLQPLRTLPASGSSGKVPSSVPSAGSARGFPPRPVSSGTGISSTVPVKAPVAKTEPEEEMPEPEIAPWEADASDTPLPSAKDTTPQSSRSGSKSRRNLQAQRRKNILIVFLVGAVIVIPLLVAGVFGAILWYLYYNQPAPQPTASSPPKFHVSRTKTGAHTCASIHLALQKAEKGSVIELWDTEHLENLIVDPGRVSTTQVTLRAAPGKEVTWRSSKTDPDEPIIKLSKATDFKLEGQGIILDGTLSKGHVKNLMTITSECKGLSVTDLRFVKFARAAVFLTNTVGTTSHPIRLHRLTTVTDKKTERPLAAIYLDANPKIPPGKNNHIEIQDCTFLGFEPPLKGVQFPDPSVIDTDVRWPERGKN